MVQRVMFTEIPNSDGDGRFQKKRYNAGGKGEKRVIAATPAPIFRGKSKKKNRNEADGKKREKSSNGDGGSVSGAAVDPIFSDKVKGCRKGGTDVGMLMGVPSHALLSDHRSADFSDQGWLEADRDREQRRNREKVLVKEDRLCLNI